MSKRRDDCQHLSARVDLGIVSLQSGIAAGLAEGAAVCRARALHRTNRPASVNAREGQKEDWEQLQQSRNAQRPRASVHRIGRNRHVQRKAATQLLVFSPGGGWVVKDLGSPAVLAGRAGRA